LDEATGVPHEVVVAAEEFPSLDGHGFVITKKRPSVATARGAHHGTSRSRDGDATYSLVGHEDPDVLHSLAVAGHVRSSGLLGLVCSAARAFTRSLFELQDGQQDICPVFGFGLEFVCRGT